MERDIATRSAPGPNAEARIFDTRPYIDAWREHLGVGQVWDLTLPGAVAPLMLVPERHCRVPLRVLRPAGSWVNPANVVIPFSGGGLEYLLANLRARKAEWDVFEFVLTLGGPAAGSWVADTLRRHDLRLIRWQDIRRPYVTIDRPWDHYYRTRARGVRRNIGHRLNKVKRCGDIRLEYPTGDAGLHALEHFFSLHKKRWASRGKGSMYADDAVRRFVRSFLKTSPPHAWRVAQLWFSGHIIATAVELKSRGTLHKYGTAMDPEFSGIAPGRLLLYSVLRDAFGGEFTEVDLGPGADGHSSYKTDWATGEYVSRRFFVAHRAAVAAWLKVEPAIKRGAEVLRLSRGRHFR